MKRKEKKIYIFKESTSADNYKEYKVKESELNNSQVSLLYSEFIRIWSACPEVVQKKFINNLIIGLKKKKLDNKFNKKFYNSEEWMLVI